MVYLQKKLPGFFSKQPFAVIVTALKRFAVLGFTKCENFANSSLYIPGMNCLNKLPLVRYFFTGL
ncbi:hypothetical protein DXN05_00110 [Deminuibacter soli]|uniref:Uncharacterized protein n=1 Tax=Deminuibacter soli TaxID=2291815 RepID=A0A3E1NNQ8_9BACT|nr:hypothetical protein DXN05_00110 [Deminuibacter soli]